MDFSDHYSQCVSVERENLDLKKITMYRRNYSTFSEDSFRDTSQYKISITTLKMLIINLRIST